MKKEKTVKTYQRRTKSGKVVTVRQHTAKYDAADKAAEASKKKGSGDELESLKKSKQVDTPMEISKDDFKEWYNFNEWDTPKKEWPDAVKKVDSHLRKTMGKKGYDDYCAKIDESWSARGHLKAYKDLSSESKSKPKPLFTKKGVVSQVNEEPKKANHIDKDFMDVYNNKTKKLTVKDYQSMSDEELKKHYDNYRYKTNSSLSRSEQYHKKAIAAEVTRRSEAKAKAEEKSARKAVGGLVSGSTWKYNSSDGSFSTSDATAWGRPDSSRVKKILQKAENSGWKKADHSSSMQPDDKGYRRVERYISPDGKYELSYNYSAGDFSSNHHSVTIKRVGDKKGTPTKSKSGSSSSSSSTKFKSSINEALNNAGFKNDISSIKVDGDSIKIRLEGKAYGDGYSSYVRYNPTRPKDGYEAEGNPKRAGRVYEALRKLKGIDKIKNLVITESYD